MSERQLPKGQAKRNYKDTVFRMVFKEKEKLLELYNGVNKTSYENPEELEITTLENAIYMSMKNDVSCCIDMNLQLYEQQSTVNPNMPLRFIQYFAKQIERLLIHWNMYSRKKIALPMPRFLIFYNGTEEQPEYRVMKLSDSYIQKAKTYSLDLVAEQYNINPGYNEELKAKCPTLMEYMEYVERVRKYNENLPLTEAVEIAIEECIREGILKEFLSKNKAEVMSMSLFEFDEEEYRKMLYEEAKEEGYAEGESAGFTKGEATEKIHIAKKMKSEGISLELICKVTGLNMSQVDDL